MMKTGLVFPQTEFPPDPAAIRDYAQAAEGLGYKHILAYDHILGANPIRPGGWNGPYTYLHPFLEPLVLFSFWAGVTQKLEFTSGVIILPQRQTAVFAKQAATLDILCGGRLRLGIGLGWNPVEYTALNQDFHSRGKRIEEQVTLLRELWSHPLVEFQGRWHTIPDAGLNPLPVQRPIPIWFGGSADKVLERIARLADGWMPDYKRVAEAQPALDKIAVLMDRYGRAREHLGIEPRINYGKGEVGTWKEIYTEWQEAGATHISLNTMKCGFDTPAKHLSAIQHFARAMNIV